MHYNQLLLTEFGKKLGYWTDDVNLAAKLQDYWTTNRENMGKRLSCLLGSDKKRQNSFYSVDKKEIGERMAKNTA